MDSYLKDEYSDKWFNIILNNTNIQWNWFSIGRNPNVTMKLILKYPNEPWDWA